MAVKSYRFSDVVKAIGTTPKSLRRWLITLDLKPEDGGWHVFHPVQVLEFGIMRHLVDWGVPVKEAAALSSEATLILMVGTDDLDRADLHTAQGHLAAIDKTGLHKLDLLQLGASLYKTRLILMTSETGGYFWGLEAPKPRSWFALRADRSPAPSSYAGSLGSFLTIETGYLVLTLAERLGEHSSGAAKIRAEVDGGSNG